MVLLVLLAVATGAGPTPAVSAADDAAAVMCEAVCVVLCCVGCLTDFFVSVWLLLCLLIEVRIITFVDVEQRVSAATHTFIHKSKMLLSLSFLFPFHTSFKVQ